MGGIKDMLFPPCQNMGGIYHPYPPQDLRPCIIVLNHVDKPLYIAVQCELPLVCMRHARSLN